MKKLILSFLVMTGAVSLSAQDYIQIHIDSPSQDYTIDATLGADHMEFPTPVSGQLAMANDGVSGPADNDEWNEVGSYCCDSIINGAEIAGKVALISRGSCSFFEKIQYAWEQGAVAVIIWNRAPLGITVDTHVDGLITMTLAGISADVDIPGYFITHEDGLELARLMQEGTVDVTFDTPAMYDAVGPYAYATPVDQIRPLDDIRVATFTREQDTLFNVEFKVTITDPESTVTELITVVPELLPGKNLAGDVQEPQVDFDTYTPPAVTGMYSMVFTATTEDGTHQLDNTVIERNFEITDYTFALEDGSSTDPDGIQMNYEVYSNLGDGLFNVGAFYRTAAAGSATHASFAIGNPQEIFDNEEFEFNIFLFDADEDGDGIIDPEFYTANELAEATYEMTGDENPNELIIVNFDVPAALEADKIYCVYVDAGDQLGFTDNQPAFTTSGDIPYPLENTYVLWGTPDGPLEETDGFEYWNDDGAGFAKAGRHPVVRLYLDGFVGLEENDFLTESQFSVGPNPARDEITLFFDLPSASNAEYILYNIEGKKIDHQQIGTHFRSIENIDLSGLDAGNYFISINTESGVATRKFVIMK